MDAHHYSAQRQTTLKETFRAKRKEAGYSQQAIADFLGCTRSHIVDVENPEKPLWYSVGEMELLAGLFGMHPLDVVRMNGKEAITLGQFVTEKQTGAALIGLVDCVLPPDVRHFYSNTEEHTPDAVCFSPSGNLVATFIDSAEAEDWEDWHDDPYQFTLLCWNARSGEPIAHMHLPYVEHIAVLDDMRLIIATTELVGPGQEDEEWEYRHGLLIWNVQNNRVERRIELPDRVENLAGSSEGTYFAVFFPRTTTIQCWQTTDWVPSHAFELETHQGDLDAPGATYQAARLVEDLPRERKFAPWIGDYQASRFAFMNDHLLVFSSGTRMVEFDLRNQQGYARSPFDHPFIPWAPVLHRRDEHGEIAVLSLKHDYRFAESQIELSYLVPPTETYRYSIETSVQVSKRMSGAVFQPTILDEATILALVEYDTTWRWHMAYKTRIGLCDLVSGRVVLLNDDGRLRDGDHQSAAQIAPKGDQVAYWICPDGGPPRLTIQSIEVAPLRVERSSLVNELTKSRQFVRAQIGDQG